MSMIPDIRNPRLAQDQRGGIALLMLMAFIGLAVPIAVASLQTAAQLARNSGVYNRNLTGEYSAASGVEVVLHDALYDPNFDDGLGPNDPPKQIQADINGETVSVTVTKSYPSGYSNPTPFNSILLYRGHQVGNPPERRPGYAHRLHLHH